MTKHTPGPWSYSGDEMEPYPIRNAEGRAVRTNERANAARIVACFNACEGMDDPAKDIADMERSIGDLAEHKAALRAQRDELAAALRDTMREFINVARDGMTPAQDAAYTRARAALAKVGGGK